MTWEKYPYEPPDIVTPFRPQRLRSTRRTPARAGAHEIAGRSARLDRRRCARFVHRSRVGVALQIAGSRVPLDGTAVARSRAQIGSYAPPGSDGRAGDRPAAPDSRTTVNDARSFNVVGSNPALRL